MRCTVLVMCCGLLVMFYNSFDIVSYGWYDCGHVLYHFGYDRRCYVLYRVGYVLYSFGNVL